MPVTHTQARFLVTHLVFACDTACSCYCMFSTLFCVCVCICLSSRLFEYMQYKCLCMCVNACTSVPAARPLRQLHISSQKVKRARSRNSHTLHSARMKLIQALCKRGKQDTYRWGVFFFLEKKKEAKMAKRFLCMHVWSHVGFLVLDRDTLSVLY